VNDARTVTARSQSFKTFKDSLNGSVLLPNDHRYDKLRTPWLEVMEQRPAVIVEAASVTDVVAAVDFAREEGLDFGVMATGHGIAAPCDGLLLRFGDMDDVFVDNKAKIAKVGPASSPRNFSARSKSTASCIRQVRWETSASSAFRWAAVSAGS